MGLAVAIGLVAVAAWGPWRPTGLGRALAEQRSGAAGRVAPLPSTSRPREPILDPPPNARANPVELDAPPPGLRGLLEQMETRPAVPIPFAEDAIPPRYAPAGFAATMSKVLESCSTPVTLLDADCAEAPCIAILQDRVGQFRPNDCPAWSASYGDTVLTNLTLKVECPEEVVFITMVAPNEAVDLTVPEPFLDSVSRRLVDRAMQWTVRDLCVGD